MRSFVVLSVFLFSSVAFFAQDVEQKKSNVQILKGLSETQMKSTMKAFSKALGVKCNFCHLKDKTVDLSDEIKDPEIRKILGHKEIAREMIRMTQMINQQYLNKTHASGRPYDKLNCAFCHRGRKDKLQENIKESFIEAKD